MARRGGRVVLGDSRTMQELEDGSVHLIVTSPPYWDIKDYGNESQIGRGSDLHTYLMDLYLVWKECFRVLKPGRRLVVNVGDQFARSRDYGKYSVVPLHAEVISQCANLGLDFMGSIIWQKRTTINSTGGAPIMGSYPYPPNGIVELDHEYIMVFKRPGKERAPSMKAKEASALTKEEWKAYFAGHWNFGGARQVDHEAVFPIELPSRLIRMFTFSGEEVLDPFLGSGTTMRAALDLGRSCTGYDINRTYLPLIKEKVGPGRFDDGTVSIFEKPTIEVPRYDPDYLPSIPNMQPSKAGTSVERVLHKVAGVEDHRTLILSDGTRLRLGGIAVRDETGALEYLRTRVRGRDISFRVLDPVPEGPGSIEALVYLKNRIFVNRYMVNAGFAEDMSLPKGRR